MAKHHVMTHPKVPTAARKTSSFIRTLTTCSAVCPTCRHAIYIFNTMEGLSMFMYDHDESSLAWGSILAISEEEI
jgi:hypothetical protein